MKDINMNYNFSCLIPISHNESTKNVQECLNSIFNQTLPPNEVIVIIDGKLNNNLKRILKRYDLKIFELKNQKGITYALNYGLKMCKYDIVARMDSDDICAIDRFETQINLFKNNNNLELIGGQILEFDNKSYKNKRLVPLNINEIIKYSKFRNPFNHMTIMFKKNVILNNDGYKDIPFFEDYYLWTKLLKNNINALNIDKVLVYARTDYNHIKRRGGYKYIKCIYNFEKQLYNDNYINLSTFIFNIILRCSISLLPYKIRSLFYEFFLRK